ncbi:hypothetical protein BDV18DRAFT_144489 [Aspergillus unguis]
MDLFNPLSSTFPLDTKMGLDFFTSSYLQYKEDTNAVATWLVATAGKCGFPVDTLGGSPTTTNTTAAAAAAAQSSKRLKGKARKKAKQAAPQPQVTAPPEQAKHILAIKDFVSLSDYIAAATNVKVSVPEGFVAVLNRAISVRRQHGDRLEETSTPDVASTDRHNYFIGILKHVKQALRPLMPSDQIKDPLTQHVDDTSTGKLGGLINRFEGLDVQEPSAAFLEAPNVTIPPVEGDKPQVDYEAERVQDVDEATFAFSLLLNDYAELRNVITSSWTGYKSGDFDLVAVSLMTNSAIDIAQRMEEEIQHLLDRFGGSERFLEITYMALSMAEGEDPDHRERPGDDLNFRTYTIAQSVFMPVCLFLRGFTDVLEPDFVPLYKPGFYGTLNRRSNRSRKSGRERYQEDKIILTEILGDFYTLHTHVPEQSYEDEFTRGLRNLFRTKKLPIWLVFAAQVFLDIQHQLRDQIERPFKDLNACASNIENSIRLNLDFHAKLRIVNWPERNDDMLSVFLNQIDDWIHEDFTKPLKRRPNLWNPDEEFKLLKWHPLLCGTLMYYFKAQFQEVGRTFAGAWGSIMYSAHLYNALRHEKLIHGNWDDMDIIISLHDGIFIGDPPRNPEGYLKQFNLATGLSATAYAKNRRQTARLPEAKNGPKGIKALNNVSHMFFERYCEGSRKTGFDAADLEKILDDGVWGDDPAGKTPRTKAAAKTRWDSSRRLPPTEVLKTLRNTLHREGPESTIDYFILHRVCWRNLRSIRRACDAQLRQLFGFEYMENETQLPFLVGWIFMAAAGVNEVGKKLDLEQFGAVKSELMVHAGDVIDVLISSGVGETMRTAAEAQGYLFK